MIRINRPTAGPTKFSTKGSAQTKKDCSDYDGSPNAYRTGKKKFASNRSIYASKEVKKSLSESQHNKCCYCETKFRAAINLAVEHFRPKTGVKQSRGLKKECPGYYWLAYEWSNLLLSCHECNSSWKQLLFPLSNPKQRARSHHQNVNIERPLLINALEEDPRVHINFRDDAPQALTRKGRISIDVLGLHRPALREDRLEKLAILESFSNLTTLAAKTSRNAQLKKLAAEAQKYLDSAVLPEAEFSSMAQDFLS